MLRAIGMSRRQVRTMIRYEAVITALIGAILGMVLGVVFAFLIAQPLQGRRLHPLLPDRHPASRCSSSPPSPASSPRSLPLAVPPAWTCSRRCSTSSSGGPFPRSSQSESSHTIVPPRRVPCGARRNGGNDDSGSTDRRSACGHARRPARPAHAACDADRDLVAPGAVDARAVPRPLRRHVHPEDRLRGDLGDGLRPRGGQAGLHRRPARLPRRRGQPDPAADPRRELGPGARREGPHRPAQAAAAALPRRADAGLRREDDRDRRA